MPVIQLEKTAYELLEPTMADVRMDNKAFWMSLLIHLHLQKYTCSIHDAS